MAKNALILNKSTRKPEIALIAPFPGLADTARPFLKDLPYAVALAEGDLEVGLTVGRRLMSRGVQVFVSRGGTARRLRSLGLPVVEIKVTAYDILSALGPLLGGGHKIGIIGFDNVIAGANRLSELLHYDLKVFTINHEREVEESIRAAQAEGVSLVLGDMVVNNLARAAGLSAVLIESGREAVQDALEEACERLALIKAEAEKNRRHLEVLSLYKTVFESVEDLIITVDHDGHIESRNPAARALLKDSPRKLTPRMLHGRTLKSLLKDGVPQYNQVVTWGGQKMILDFFPLNTGYEDGPAAVVLGRSVRQVETSERRIRHALYLSGHAPRFHFNDLVGKSRIFLDSVERAREYADSDATILIEGESGTGKEMLAQSIHTHKFGLNEPFVAINCATLPEQLLESELFGYVRGAFTGARAEGKKGLFELAHGGTLFLDEVGEMPLTLQSRLLRVIEERAVFPLGSDHIIPVNVRLIAATNTDLPAAVRERRFRSDLYFRLGVLTLTLPPLRERGRDAELLFRTFVAGINPRYKPTSAERETMAALLMSYAWPGNAREMKNLVQRLSIVTAQFTRSIADLPDLLAREMKELERLVPVPGPDGAPQPASGQLGLVTEDWRGGLASPLSRKEMAARLGISRTTLWRRLKALEARKLA